MKKGLTRDHIAAGITALLVLCGAILFYFLLFQWTDFFDKIRSVLGVFAPVILGIVIAFLLNPIMVFLERRIVLPLWNKLKVKTKKHDKEKFGIRAISVLLTMIVYLLIIYGLIMLIVPQVVESIESIIVKIPDMVGNGQIWVTNKTNELLINNPDIEDLINQYWENVSSTLVQKIIPSLQEMLSKTSSSLVGSVIGVFKGLLNFIIGTILSIYLLYSKERFCAQCKKVAYALFREERANNLINNMRYISNTFTGFVSGKILDSVIIGILCYIFMLILRIPYPALIAVIVGVTNVIPCFGPFIGAIPCALLLILIDPMKCLTFVIFVFILQQFDGNVLGPKILGDSTGLNSFWVIFAITVFSGLFGVLGMFIGVPIFAVIYAAIKTFINERLECKNLPVKTDYYVHSDFEPDIPKTLDRSGQKFTFVKKTFENIVPEKRLGEREINDRKQQDELNAKSEYPNIMQYNENKDEE